ncbi:hypothetical protein A5707_12990 [Mycobacterium kyorinense]|uniref:Uncharacterized protein n=1 Tax=Mycobacterium kyorinense TaxID=487514 RepID=A0A1A2ZS50_9MYCO|nr:hypothetical protein [Mycobacterium kyorinense]OBI51891.1 hypothetical protein A5707_12990 [Mycobacterium kyorinense]
MRSRVGALRIGWGLWAGAAAGAAGTTALNVLGYLDMALRGRPASTTPEETVKALVRLLHWTIPGAAEAQPNRIVGVGALLGIAAGIGIGALLGLLRSLGWRPGKAITTVVATAGALIGTNGPMVALGVTNPLDWGVMGWIADVVPHLGYGLVTAWVLCHLDG